MRAAESSRVCYCAKSSRRHEDHPRPSTRETAAPPAPSPFPAVGCGSRAQAPPGKELFTVPGRRHCSQPPPGGRRGEGAHAPGCPRAHLVRVAPAPRGLAPRGPGAGLRIGAPRAGGRAGGAAEGSGGGGRGSGGAGSRSGGGRRRGGRGGSGRGGGGCPWGGAAAAAARLLWRRTRGVGRAPPGPLG